MTTQDIASHPAAARRLSFAWLVPVAALAIALASRPGHGNNWDISLLLTWAEKFLAGARPDIDFIEVNPPGAYLVYTPAVLLAHLTGLSADLMVEVLVFAAIGASLTLAAAILAACGTVDRRCAPFALAAAILLLGVLPGISFGQREHIGTIAILPFLAVIIARAKHAPPSFWMQAAAGLGAGFSIVAKPHFALVLSPLLVYAVMRARSIRSIFHVEWLITGIVAAIYFVAIVVFFPNFLSETLPAVVAIYLPVRDSMMHLATELLPFDFCVLLACLIAFSGRMLLAPMIIVPLLAALGGAVGFVLQGKGWPNHAYCPIVLVGLAFVLAIADKMGSAKELGVKNVILIGLAAFFASLGYLSFDSRADVDSVGLARAIERVHPHPKLVVLAGNTEIGFPLVRMVGGKWMQRYSALWITDCVNFQLENTTSDPDRRRQLTGYIEAQKQSFGEDIERGRPDIIVAQVGPFNWMAWARTSQTAAHALADYEPAEQVGNLVILRRKPDAFGQKST